MIINLRKNETFERPMDELQVETFFKTTNIMFRNRLELIIENRKITIFRNSNLILEVGSQFHN